MTSSFHRKIKLVDFDLSAMVSNLAVAARGVLLRSNQGLCRLSMFPSIDCEASVGPE